MRAHENAARASRRRRAWARVLVGAAACAAVFACGTTMTPRATVSLDPSVTLTGTERLYVGWLWGDDVDADGLPLAGKAINEVQAFDAPIGFPVDYVAAMTNHLDDTINFLAWLDPAPCAGASCPAPAPAAGQHYGAAVHVPRDDRGELTIDRVVP